MCICSEDNNCIRRIFHICHFVAPACRHNEDKNHSLRFPLVWQFVC